MNWNGKRVLVTGGTGFIGSHLVKKLEGLGAELFLLTHEQPTEHMHHKCDIAKLDGEAAINLRWFAPEVVFHLAAQPLVSKAMDDALSTLEVNVRGTYNFLEVCKSIKHLKSFVHISTDKVYGNVSPITKDTHPGGVHHPYNASKLASDSIAQMYANFFGVPMVVIRNANVYGAGDRHYDRIVPRTIRNILHGVKPVVRGDGSNTRDYVHVSEIVDGYIKSAELPYEKPLTILNLGGFNHSVIQVIDTVLQKMNRVDLAPIFESQWAGEIPHQHIENDLAKELIDWNPKIDIEQGVEMSVQWYKENEDG